MKEWTSEQDKEKENNRRPGHGNEYWQFFLKTGQLSSIRTGQDHGERGRKKNFRTKTRSENGSIISQAP